MKTELNWLYFQPLLYCVFDIKYDCFSLSFFVSELGPSMKELLM